MVGSSRSWTVFVSLYYISLGRSDAEIIRMPNSCFFVPKFFERTDANRDMRLLADAVSESRLGSWNLHGILSILKLTLFLSYYKSVKLRLLSIIIHGLLLILLWNNTILHIDLKHLVLNTPLLRATALLTFIKTAMHLEAIKQANPSSPSRYTRGS